MRVISFSYITLALVLAASAAPVIEIDGRSQGHDGDVARRDDVSQPERRAPPARTGTTSTSGPGRSGSRKSHSGPSRTGTGAGSKSKSSKIAPGSQTGQGELQLLKQAQKDGGNAGFENVLKAEEKAQGN